MSEKKTTPVCALLFLICAFVGCNQNNPNTDNSTPPVVEKASAEDANSDESPSDDPEKTSLSSDDGNANRQLPMPGTEESKPGTEESKPDSEQDGPMQANADSASGQDSADEPDAWEPPEKTFEDIAAEAFSPPPGATPLTQTGRLWIDVKRSRVYVDGYVCMKRGPLEMFACPAGTKEHESIVATLARSREVHAALLAVEGTPGTPVRFQPEFSPPTGDIIRVFACWYDDQGKFQTVDARSWVEDLETESQMESEWVFAGSEFYTDPETKEEFYLAESGDMICVSNFSSAMVDVAIPSSANNGDLRFVPFEKQIPEVGTPVRLVLVPIAVPSDGSKPEGTVDEPEKPVESELPRAVSKDDNETLESSGA